MAITIPKKRLTSGTWSFYAPRHRAIRLDEGAGH
jgi:hypothetical protein